jgi:hypothetical protein
MADFGPWNVTLRRLEDGFFVDEAQVQARMPAQFSLRPIAGLGEALVQFFRIRVDADDFVELGGEVWLVSLATTSEQARLEELRTSLGKALPHVDFCFMVETREGFERVVGSARRAIVIAAATAVVKYYASWDESNPIVIAIGEERFAITVGFVGKNYRVAVRRLE